jgi:hypothetical protein
MAPSNASGPATESVSEPRVGDHASGRLHNTQNITKPQARPRDLRRRKGEADGSQRVPQKHGNASMTHPKAGPNGAGRRTRWMMRGAPESSADRNARGYNAGRRLNPEEIAAIAAEMGLRVAGAQS